jgi:hypothetical protein
MSDIDQQNNAPGESVFANTKQVHAFLVSQGWKVCQRAVYNHVSEGKLRKKDGVFTLAAVGKYARTFLQRQDSGQTVPKEHEHLQQEKLALEVERLKIQIKKDAHRLGVEQGAYLPREDFELELAARASVFDAGFRYFFQASAAELIALVGGNNKKIPDFLAAVNTKLDMQLNEYASTKEYQVMILGPEKGPVPTEKEERD